jgi:hypothetical protein
MSTSDQKAYAKRAKDRKFVLPIANRMQSFIRTFGTHIHKHYDATNKEMVERVTALGPKACTDSATPFENYSSMSALPSPQTPTVKPLQLSSTAQAQSQSSPMATAPPSASKSQASSQLASAPPSAPKSQASLSNATAVNKGQYKQLNL